jgi:hypothetical protein
VLGVQRERDRERRRSAGRVATALLRAALTGSARPAELAGTATAAGLADAAVLRVLALDGLDPVEGHAVLTDLLPEALVADLDGEVLALRPGADRPTLRDLLRRLGSRLGERRIVLGVSSAVAVPELGGAVQEARHARRVGQRRAGRIEVVAGEEAAAHQLLLATAPEELRRAIHRRLLGPLLDYDAAHGADLVGTLTVFLDRDGSWVRAAEVLHVHVNTLRYRIGRIEQLLGVDLGEFSHRVDLFLALHAAPGA